MNQLSLEHISIRPPRKLEMPAVVRFWTEIFEIEAEYFRALLDADPSRRQSQTLVAFGPCGEVLSSLQIFRRKMVGPDGLVLLIGGIGSVSTCEHARGIGLSALLLRAAIETMRGMGCSASWLFTGIHSHYRKQGWYDRPTLHTTGTIRELPSTTLVASEALDGDWCRHWRDLAQVYRACHSRRPLTVRRGPAVWQHSMRYFMTPPRGQVWVARGRRTARPCAYLVSCESKGKHQIREFAYLPGKEGVFADLLGFVLSRSPGQKANLSIPLDDFHRPILESALSHLARKEDPWSMAMSLSDKLSDEAIHGWFEHPSAQHFQSDNF